MFSRLRAAIQGRNPLKSLESLLRADSFYHVVLLSRKYLLDEGCSDYAHDFPACNSKGAREIVDFLSPDSLSCATYGLHPMLKVLLSA